MFGRKAKRIRELEAENAELYLEIRELKDTLKSTVITPPVKSSFAEGRDRNNAKKAADRVPIKTIKKKKSSAIIGRKTTVINREVHHHHQEDDGPGFGTGLVTGIVLSNMMNDHDHHSSKEDNFSGGGGEFGGGGASGGWDGGGAGGGGGGSD